MYKVIKYMLISVFSVFVLSSIDTHAENNGDKCYKEPPLKYEVRLGWGGYPLTAFLLTNGCHPYQGVTDAIIEDLYAPYTGPVFMTGNITCEFAYHFRWWFSLSAGLGVNGIWSNNYDAYDGRKISQDAGAITSLLVQPRFTYLNKKNVKLYSSVGLGLTYLSFNYEHAVLPLFHIAPIGIIVGRKVFGFCELNMGVYNLGASAGVGIRF